MRGWFLLLVLVLPCSGCFLLNDYPPTDHTEVTSEARLEGEQYLIDSRCLLALRGAERSFRKLDETATQYSIYSPPEMRVKDVETQRYALERCLRGLPELRGKIRLFLCPDICRNYSADNRRVVDALSVINADFSVDAYASMPVDVAALDRSLRKANQLRHFLMPPPPSEDSNPIGPELPRDADIKVEFAASLPAAPVIRNN